MAVIQDVSWQVEIPKGWGRPVTGFWHGPHAVLVFEADDGTLRVVELGARQQVVERIVRV